MAIGDGSGGDTGGSGGDTDPTKARLYGQQIGDVNAAAAVRQQQASDPWFGNTLSSLGLNATQIGGQGQVWTPGLVPNASDYGQYLGPMGIPTGAGAPGQGSPITWSPGLGDAFPYVTGAFGAVLGGPLGAAAGYAAGKGLQGSAGNNDPNGFFGGTPTGGAGGGGGTSMYGSGAMAEADAQRQRSNVIGDAWQNNYGNPNLAMAQGWAGAQQARGNVIGDAFQNNYGNPNAANMADQAAFYNGRGGGYVNMGVGDTNAAALARAQQMGYGGAGYGAGVSQFGQSDMYGSRAGGDYGAQTSAGQAQMQQAAMAGRAGQTLLGMGSQYNTAAQRNANAAAGAQQGMAAYGALGGGYGSSQMGTSAGLLGGAAQDYGAQQGSRNASMDAIGRLQNFYQQGPGPSAAQAQLQSASEANMGQALALARSGRGAGDNAAAMRQAQFQNAATQQQTGQQMAQLRAQEEATWRGQQLGAMGQEQSALGNLRGQDLSSMQANLGSAAQFGGLGYQGIGLGANQANTLGSQNLTAQGQNLGAMSSLYGLGLQGMGQQQSGLSSARGQDLTAYGANLGAQQGMGSLGYQGYNLGLNAATTAGAQGLTSAGQNQQMGLGYAQLGQGYQNAGLANQLAYAQLANQQYQSADQLAAQYNLGGLQNQLGYASMANQQYQSGDQLRAQILNAQLQADTARYGADKGVQVGMAQLQAQQQAALIGGIAAGVGALSDVRAKKKMFPVNGILGEVFGKKDDEDEGQAPSLQDAMKKAKMGPSYLNPYGAAPDANGQFGTMAVNVPGAQPMPLPGDPANDLAMQGLNVPMPKSDERSKEAIHRVGQMAGYVSSPREAKRDIRPVDMAGAPDEYASAWNGTSLQDSMAPPQTQPAFSFSAPPPARPGVDLRPAQGYSYQYKDPSSPGAAPGTHIGPMAQDLEKTPAGRSVVKTDPRTGMKAIDTSRLSLVNTAALSEQQRRLERLEAMARPAVSTDALDAAYARQAADVGSRFGGRR